MNPNKPPNAIYLQVHGEDRKQLLPDDFKDHERVDNFDVTWCKDKIYDTDVRYVIDKRYKRRRKK